jgi:hypothetical protein
MVRLKVMTRRYIVTAGDVKSALTKSSDATVQVVRIHALDLRGDDFADA